MADSYIEPSLQVIPRELHEEFISYLPNNPELMLRIQGDPYVLHNDKSFLHTLNDALRARIDSNKDSLTGLRNRRYFEEHMPAVFRQARRDYRDSGKGVTLTIVDMIGLKWLNENRGMEEGNARLVHIADAMRNVYERPSDMLVRYGGDEFIAVVSKTKREDAVNLVEETRRKLLSVSVEPKIEIYSGVGEFMWVMGSHSDLFQMAEHELNIRKRQNHHTLARQ